MSKADDISRQIQELQQKLAEETAAKNQALQELADERKDRELTESLIRYALAEKDREMLRCQAIIKGRFLEILPDYLDENAPSLITIMRDLDAAFSYMQSNKIKTYETLRDHIAYYSDMQDALSEYDGPVKMIEATIEVSNITKKYLFANEKSVDYFTKFIGGTWRSSHTLFGVDFHTRPVACLLIHRRTRERKSGGFSSVNELKEFLEKGDYYLHHAEYSSLKT